MWQRGEQEAEGAASPVLQERLVVAGIGPTVIIKGDLISAEDLTIDGRVEGTITLGDHALSVGVGAAIRAKLVAKTITISGAVTGTVTAADKVEIRETGSVDGDVRAPRFAMQDGAVICGRVDTSNANAVMYRDRREQFPVAV
jgi:cytoskeletal protein CcmA (bactofilin family)